MTDTVDIEELKKRLDGCIEAASWEGARDDETLRKARSALDRLQQENAELTEECKAISSLNAEIDAKLAELEQENARLQRELDEARKDAERYRWVRSKDRGDWDCKIFVTNDGHKDHYSANIICEEELDTAIDAARQQQRQNRGMEGI